jgi:hypothetical protein
MAASSGEFSSLLQSSSTQLKQVAFRGIPHELRPQVWLVLLTRDVKTTHHNRIDSAFQDSNTQKALKLEVSRHFQPRNQALLQMGATQERVIRVCTLLLK